MKGHDYPIEHFRLMAIAAEQLKALSVQLLRHEYRYDAFGSWWFIYQQKGINYRVVFDGRDSVLTLEAETSEPNPWGNEWEEIKGKSFQVRDDKDIPERIKILVES